MEALNVRFIEPLDVLFMRGNKLFGEAGSFGEALVPPRPSIAAGALRSRMLEEAGMDPQAFAQGRAAHPQLGTPQAPGPFTLTAFHLARRLNDGRVEGVFALPADLVVEEAEGGAVRISRLRPLAHAARGLESSYPLPMPPVLAQQQRVKPASGYWLTEAGWRAYLAGATPAPTQLEKSSALWTFDIRVGIGLDRHSRRAAEHQLFSTQGVAFKQGVGFLTVVRGADPPQEGMLRFGGDGRAAAVHAVSYSPPQPDYQALSAAGRCRLVLTSPGIFTQGWLPNGFRRQGDDYCFELHGVRGRLVCAAVPRAEVVSGWDLAQGRPKGAQRAAPTGSVYWLEELEAAPDALRTLVERGLWSESCEDVHRRAEGFNRLILAAY